MFIIVATEKATGIRYGYCLNSGVVWFAPGTTSLCMARLPLLEAQQEVMELKLQELVRLFRKQTTGSHDPITVNLNGFDLAIESSL